jgi:hypothetical protein
MRFHETKYQQAEAPSDRACVRFNQWRALIAKLPPGVASEQENRMCRVLLAEIERLTEGSDRA